jgi:hypothetical protein
MIPNNQNYMEVEIGGQLRKIKMGMATCQKVSNWYLNYPEETYDPIKRQLKIVAFGLQHKENALPEGFDEEMLADWIDELDQDVWDKIEEFTMQALGFMVATINNKAEKMMYKAEEESK